MKNLILVAALFSIFSLQAKADDNNGIVLDEIMYNEGKREEEAELNSIEANYICESNDIYLQEIPFDVVYNEVDGFYHMNDITLISIQLDIPNFEYIDELESVEYNLL